MTFRESLDAGPTMVPTDLEDLERSLYSSDDRYDFNGTLFSALDTYKAEMLESSDELRRRVGITRCLGDVLTGDIIARGRAVIQSIDARNQNPFYPPIFLTFHQYPQWIGGTDRALCRMKRALIARPKTYRRFVKEAADQPLGGLFELNVYAALEDAFPGAEPQPQIPGTKKRGDARVLVDGKPIYVESSVLDESRYWKNLRTTMLMAGRSVWAAPGPGPAHGAFRIVSKISRESIQTAADATNIVCLSFFDTLPIPEARQWAFDDLWAGGKRYGNLPDGTSLDLSNVPRVDSIFEFSRDTLLRIHINPNAYQPNRLSDGDRNRLRDAFSASKFMIR